MLLQQGMPVRIWGTADAGETVLVTARDQRVSVKAGSNGKWQVFLQPMKPGPAFEMTAGGKAIHDVLVGEVWVGSGQSNMEFPVSRAFNSATEIADANYPQIRLFTVKRAVADEPREDVEGSWSLCTPESVKSFSAIAYFFGREIHKKQHVAVGLIHTSWGGTPAQSWTEPSFLKEDAALQTYLTNWQKTLDAYPANQEKYQTTLAKWQEAAAAAKAEGKTGPNRPAPPQGPGHQNTPSGLYNAMIAPITPYAIRGALWYQGESNANANEAWLYRRLFTSMIESWRQAWGQGTFPFYFVQLANFRTNGWWPLLRESQNEALDLRQTGEALAIDFGNPTDIHPTHKQEVAHRLALAALAQTYGEKIEYSGPVFRELMVVGSQARLLFDHAGGMTLKAGSGKSFQIAGSDGKFVPAQAKVEGSLVVLTCPEVPEPAAVRYAWQDDPEIVLYNSTGLPASPFRTDVWKDAKALP